MPRLFQRPLTAILVALALVSGAWAVMPERVLGCTGPGVPPADPTLTAVVFGRVTATNYEPRAESDANPPALWLNVTVDVERYLRGSGPSSLVIADGSSAAGDPDDVEGIFWLGPCRAFAEDPTGKYLVAGVPSDPANFSTFTVYGYGATPEEVQSSIDWVAEELALAGVTPATVGHGVGGSATPWAALGFCAVGLGVLATARGLTRGRR